MNKPACLALALFLLPAVSYTAAPPDQVARLGKDLTEVGAERAGNKDGSVPAYIGKAAFAPEMLKLTRSDLENLRKRLVKDIQGMISDPAVTADILTQAQAIMDAEPKKFDYLFGVVIDIL